MMLSLFKLKNLVLGGGFLSITFVCANGEAQNDPVVVGQTFLAGSIDPTEGSAPWALTSHGISENLFTVNAEGEIVPQIAESVRKITDEGDAWEVVLKPDYKFSNGEKVTAQHVADALTELNEKNPSAKSSLGNMTVTAVNNDEVTIRIESERPSHVMDAVLAEWVFAIYLKDDEGNFVFTGPYAVENFDVEENNRIDLVPNRHYDDRSFERPSITIQKYADGHDLADGLQNNEIDIAFHLPIDTLPELRDADGVRVKSFEVGYHYMMFFNLDSIEDVDVRKAIDVAIDRTELSQALAGGTGTRSLFPDYSPYYSDDSDPHSNEDEAGKLLDEAGWTINPDTGKRENEDGDELTVTLVAYPHRPGLVIMQPIIEKAMTDLGINVETILTGMDWDETQKIMDDRSFDILMWAQNTLPAGDPLWFLNSFFRSDGGNNHANFADENVDEALDALSLAEDHKERIELSSSAQNLILDQVPVSNLVTPMWHVGLSDRMADYVPYGSDYYVIRSDLFTTDATMDAGSTSIEVVKEDSDDNKDGGSSDDNDNKSVDPDNAPDISAMESTAAIMDQHYLGRRTIIALVATTIMIQALI